MNNEITIRYQMERRDMWLELYFGYFHHPVAKWLTWACIALLIYGFLHTLAVTHSLAGASLRFVGTFFHPWSLLLLIFLKFFNKMPTSTSPRICFATIDAVDFECLVPEKRYIFPWKKVISVRQTVDYLLFFSLWGCFTIPKRAFGGLAEAQAFFETALYYKQATKLGQPLTEGKEGEVWPPPPRVGA